MILDDIQDQMKPWLEHNFGNRPAWQPLVGLMEELGELSHAFLKREQGIHTNENHDEAIRDAVADILIYLMDFCNTEGINLASQVCETWAKVWQRDWQKHSDTGEKEAND